MTAASTAEQVVKNREEVKQKALAATRQKIGTMLIVDDIFMSVGSANKNNRGMVYEAEMNVAILDAAVGPWRKRILANLIGGEANADVAGWFDQLRSLARTNDDVVRSNGVGAAPRGFVYGLSFGPEAACKLQSVGPDAT